MRARWARRKQRLVTDVVIHHQMPVPVLQEGARMGPSTAGLVVEHDNARPVIEPIGAVCPQIGMFGLATAGVELAHRCFVGMQATSFPEQVGQPVGQRLQSYTDTPDPLAER